MTGIPKTERPDHRFSKFDREAIPRPLPPASPAKEPLAAELNPTQGASVHLTSWDLIYSDRRRETTSPELVAQLLRGRLSLPTARLLMPGAG
jgi:hypothetical protein